jgi:hypothetical protein
VHALPAASPNLVLWSVVAAPVATVHRLKRVRRTVIRPTCGSTAAERIYSRTKKGSNRYCPSEQIVSGRAAIARLGSTGKNGQLATNQGESSCLPRVNLPARSGLSHGGRDGDAPPNSTGLPGRARPVSRACCPALPLHPLPHRRSIHQQLLHRGGAWPRRHTWTGTPGTWSARCRRQPHTWTRCLFVRGR